jgi:ubiquinone/menaquinone biosynthesis C-methylase UbiE
VATSDHLFAGSIPEMYDRYMAPMLFEPYAVDLAERVAGAAPNHVLETAAGTGVLTRELVQRLSAKAAIVATDLNPPMVQYAAAKCEDARVEWRAANALELPFEDGGFEAVACQFGAMFFPDAIQGYREALRVLKPGGRFIFNVWDRIEANEFADHVTAALATVFPADPPRFMARIPHGYYDTDRIRSQLTAAGFGKISISAVERMSRAPSARDAALGYCQGSPLRTEIEACDASRLEEATERAADALARRFGAGPIEGRMSAFAIEALG